MQPTTILGTGNSNPPNRRAGEISDRVGREYGRLTVIAFDHKKGVHTWWLCKCVCGSHRVVKGALLTEGKTKSCGCLYREARRLPRPSYPKLPEREACLRHSLSLYSKSARNRSLEFTLGLTEIESLVFGDCYYCGQPPSRQASRTLLVGTVRTNVLMNGIDRRDNQAGYVEGNVVSCCQRCNMAKWTTNEADFLLWIESVYMHGISKGRFLTQ